MKNAFLWIILSILAIGIIVAVIMLFRKPTTEPPTSYTPPAPGTGSGSGTTSGSGSNSGAPYTGGSSTGTGSTGTTPTAPAPKTLNDMVGKTIVAKYNNTKVYNNDLSVAKVFNAGEKIGWLGDEAVKYVVCTDRPGYHKVHGSSIASTGFASCEPIMSSFSLKQIFNV